MDGELLHCEQTYVQEKGLQIYEKGLRVKTICDELHRRAIAKIGRGNMYLRENIICKESQPARSRNMRGIAVEKVWLREIVLQKSVLLYSDELSC